jgi:hypothetical protein
MDFNANSGVEMVIMLDARRRLRCYAAILAKMTAARRSISSSLTCFGPERLPVRAIVHLRRAPQERLHVLRSANRTEGSPSRGSNGVPQKPQGRTVFCLRGRGRRVGRSRLARRFLSSTAHGWLHVLRA